MVPVIAQMPGVVDKRLTVRPDEAVAVNVAVPPISPVLGAVKLIVCAGREETVRVNVVVPVWPGFEVSEAMTVCVPAAKAEVTLKDQTPLAFALTRPTILPSILIEILPPAVAVPEMVGVGLEAIAGLVIVIAVTLPDTVSDCVTGVAAA